MAGTPRSGSGFINFSDFVGANQGAINRTRGAMLDPIKRKLDNAATDEAYGMEDLQRNTGANTLRYDPNRVNAEGGESLGSVTYGGPNSALDDANFSHAFGDAASANKEAQRATSIYGRAGALRDQFGVSSPTYGAGQQMFDSALLGAGAGRGQFDQTAKTAGHLFDKFQQDAGTIDASIRAAKDVTTSAAAQYRNAWQAPPLAGDTTGHKIDTPGTMTDAPPKPKGFWNWLYDATGGDGK